MRGFGCVRRERAHHAEARALLQVQIEDDHVDRIALHGRERRRLGISGADQLDFRDLPDCLRQTLREDLGVFHEQDSQALAPSSSFPRQFEDMPMRM